MNKAYKKQVQLLLDVLPEIAKEPNFVLHGGTAINMFVRNMPRLSVDIDLTYVPIENRTASLENINQALARIKSRIETIKPDARVIHQQNICKLQVALLGVQIKVELNMVGRGTLSTPKQAQLCRSAQNEFDAFCSMPLVPLGQLYGGKICAALDRQHPRDLFDVKLLMDNEGFTDEIKKGFLYGLLSGDRPIHELLSPRLQDQRAAFENQFTGMTKELFTYDDYQVTRDGLIQTVRNALTEKDKTFLLGVNNLEPNWTIYPFEKFPSVQWKLLNLEKLKRVNPDKHLQQHNTLTDVLAS